MLKIDFTNMMDSCVAGGISGADWADAAARFREARAAVRKKHAAGQMGFIDVASDRPLLEQTLRYAEQSKRLYDDVVVLGIGGSALGAIALRTALRPTGWNTIAPEHRHGLPRLYVLDTIDPETVAPVLDRLNLARTLFIVVSKSGSTAETMAQFLIIRDRLVKSAHAWAGQNTVFITDPELGALRPLAKAEGIDALDIPTAVGGRFSVLTPVGLLPAALIGVPVHELIEGAAEMVARCDTDELSKNPAGVFAMLQWLSDTRHGRRIQVMMPYADALKDFALWFVQLWAESLGKIRPDGSHVGPTPFAALGATDQHSVVQLFMEGPPDKTISFITVDHRPVDLTIPHAYPNITELSYLGGHTLGELLDAEQRATAGALARRGRPNCTIRLERLDGHNVGQLIMLLEMATAYAGELYGVNAFDQPGVELGKRFTYAQLGRTDAEQWRKEWEGMPKGDSRWLV